MISKFKFPIQIIKRLSLLILLILLSYYSASAQTIHYTYDNLGRLTSVLYPDSSKIAYTYDAVGNRLSERISSKLLIPQITFAKTDTVKYGAANFAAGAKSTNTATALIYTSSDTTIASIIAGNIHIKKAGSVTITVSQPATKSYAAASATQTLTILKASLTITANNIIAIQGQALPKLTASYRGFVNNETPAVLSAQPQLSTTATSSSAQGYYAITANSAAAANYNITYVQGRLAMVTLAYLEQPITSKIYGNTDFYTFGTATNGVAYNSSNARVATVDSTGKLHITGAGTTTITFGTGSGHLSKTLTVGKAPLTVTANNQFGIQGRPLPQLTLSYSGFVNGDTTSILTALPVCATSAVTSSAQGYYPITVSGGNSSNYTFNYVSGRLTMVTLVFLEASINKTYGDPDFYVFGIATSGIIYSTNNTSVATVNSAGLLHLTGAGNTGIVFGNTSGSLIKPLTVNPAKLNIIADNQTIVAGTANPQLTYSFNGFVNGESAGNLDMQPTISTSASASYRPGVYPVLIAGASSKNYSFNYVSGMLTIQAIKLDDLNEPIVSTALSPNGDGVNDVLIIKNIEKFHDNKLIVLDGNGSKVYESINYDNVSKVFNGRSSITGKLQLPGTYFYELQYKDDKTLKTKTGFIVIKY